MPANSEHRQSRSYSTEAEAWAFLDGVEMVNDSAITDLTVTGGSGPYHVQWADSDASQEDGDND
jgi:hypothetical protein